MTVYTINLSRARMAGRNKRAKKAMSILKEELERREGEVSISSDVNAEIWSRGARKPPAKIRVDIVETGDGKRAVLPGQEVEEPEQEEVEETEEEPEEETGDEEAETEDESEVDYDEILSGTVKEAKQHIRDLENPDHEALLEAEKNGKDRKTLKEFLENRLE